MSASVLIAKNSIRLMDFLKKLRGANHLSFSLVLQQQAHEDSAEELKLIQDVIVFIADKYKLSLDVNDVTEEFFDSKEEGAKQMLIQLLEKENPELAGIVKSMMHE